AMVGTRGAGFPTVSGRRDGVAGRAVLGEVLLPLGLHPAEREPEPVTRRVRLAGERQPGVVREPVLLARVAAPARRHHVVPYVLAAQRPGKDVVHVLRRRA